MRCALKWHDAKYFDTINAFTADSPCGRRNPSYWTCARRHESKCARVRPYKWGNGRFRCASGVAASLRWIHSTFVFNYSRPVYFMFPIRINVEVASMMLCTCIKVFKMCFCCFVCLSLDFQWFPLYSIVFKIYFCMFIDLHLFCWFRWFWEGREEGWAGLVLYIFFKKKPKIGESREEGPDVSEQIAVCSREWPGKSKCETCCKIELSKSRQKHWCPLWTADACGSMSCRVKSCHVMLRYDMPSCDVQCCDVHGCCDLCNTFDAWTCMVRMRRMFGMFVLHAFSFIVKVLCVFRMFFSKCSVCEKWYGCCDGFSHVSSSVPFQSRKLQRNEGRCINWQLIHARRDKSTQN